MLRAWRRSLKSGKAVSLLILLAWAGIDSAHLNVVRSDEQIAINCGLLLDPGSAEQGRSGVAVQIVISVTSPQGAVRLTQVGAVRFGEGVSAQILGLIGPIPFVGYSLSVLLTIAGDAPAGPRTVEVDLQGEISSGGGGEEAPPLPFAATCQGEGAFTVIGVPDIAVSPEEMDFALVAPGESCRLELSLANRGGASLTVASVALARGIEFQLDRAGVLTAFVIPPGEAAVIPVVFRPGGSGGFRDALTVRSDDPDEGTVQVDLRGEGRALPAVEDEDGLSAEILAISGGELAVQLPGGEDLLCPRVGMRLPDGAWVHTGLGSDVTLGFRNHARVVIQELGSVKVDRFLLQQKEGEEDEVTTRVKMKFGKIRVRTASAADRRTDMKVATPILTTGVRGTTFSVERDDETGASAAVIYEGSMEVSRIAVLPLEVWEETDLDDLVILETVTITGDGRGNGQRATVTADGRLIVEDLTGLDPEDWRFPDDGN